jgi:hypothetical protein
MTSHPLSHNQQIFNAEIHLDYSELGILKNLISFGLLALTCSQCRDFFGKLKTRNLDQLQIPWPQPTGDIKISGFTLDIE